MGDVLGKLWFRVGEFQVSGLGVKKVDVVRLGFG